MINIIRAMKHVGLVKLIINQKMPIIIDIIVILVAQNILIILMDENKNILKYKNCYEKCPINAPYLSNSNSKRMLIFLF